MFKLLNPNPRKLWLRYVIGVSLLAALLIGGHLLYMSSIEAGAKDAAIIDMSGRQRMLSQRMSGLAQEMTDPQARIQRQEALESAATLFLSSHEKLLRHAEAVPAAMALYAPGAADGLDAHVRAFTRDVRRVVDMAPDDPQMEKVLKRVRVAAFHPLLSDLNAAVQIFARDAEARHARLTDLQTIALLASLGLLAVEAVLIFWPAHRSVLDALTSAEDREVQLRRRNGELQSLSDRLEHSALHDQLTGLANRKKLYAHLENILGPEGGVGRICVMHVDLDRFKEVNDTLGHAVGDAVLKRAAEAMRTGVRNGDLVARVGGDEFVIVAVIKGADHEAQARKIADGLIRRVKAPMLIGGENCSVGASVGYTFAADKAAAPGELIANADLALYAAKDAGKGVAIPYEPAMRTGMERRHALIQDLERAIDAGEFIPFFQPKVFFADGAPAGFEVLARWDHPKRGILPPSEFLDIAEETGLMGQIDRAIQFAGLDALTAFRARGYRAPCMAFNASAALLRDAEYCADLRMAVAMRQLSPADVRVEVLETTLISDREDKALDTLRTLTSEGFRIDVDDFGTGYASLSMLARLDLTGLKIDRGLVFDLEKARTRQVLEAIIGLGKGMALEIVAEGVETSTQFAKLRSMGCDIAQGFGLGRPMGFEDACTWLETYGAKPGLQDGTPPALRTNGGRTVA